MFLCIAADHKHGAVGPHFNFSAEQMVVGVTKTEGSTAWLFDEAYTKGDPFAYDNCYYCPPMHGHAKAVMETGDGVKVSNPYQKPRLLYAHLVRRYSSANGVVAEFTAGSGTLAATCAFYDDLRRRTGAFLLFNPCFHFSINVVSLNSRRELYRDLKAPLTS